MPATRDLKSYTDVLERVTGVSAWVVTRTRSSEHQRYLLADRPESERTVERTAVNVSIAHDHDQAQGHASISLFGDAPLERSVVEDAVFRASLQSNPPYALPGPATPLEVEATDRALGGDVRGTLDDVQDRIFSAVTEQKGVRLSASEMFVTRAERELVSSNGVALADGATSIMMELALIASGEGGTETESFGSYTVRRLSDLDVAEIVERHARRARHKLVTELPATRTGPVVLSEGSFVPLLGPFTFGTGGSAIYREISPLRPGASVFGDREVKGDPLTLTSDPTLPYGMQSRGFDGEGLCLRRVPVIERNIFETIVADKQHADYLDVEPTGNWHNRVVPAGSVSLDELLDTSDGPVLHIVEFSWLNPDDVRGNFSTEIRLAYELAPGGTTRVISGGSVAGNAYDAFADARHSRETGLDGIYSGPKAVRFGEIRVTGG